VLLVARRVPTAAIVQAEGKGPLLIDLCSKAGVALDGRRVPPLTGVPLKHGSSIVFVCSTPHDPRRTT
jgi:hypothetical protein